MTVEVRLGTPKILKMRVGDTVSVREDVWSDGQKVEEIPAQAAIRIKQLLYFESFEELLSTIDYSAAIPSAVDVQEALAKYRDFYPEEDEYEYGAVAITFELLA